MGLLYHRKAVLTIPKKHRAGQTPQIEPWARSEEAGRGSEPAARCQVQCCTLSGRGAGKRHSRWQTKNDPAKAESFFVWNPAVSYSPGRSPAAFIAHWARRLASPSQVQCCTLSGDSPRALSRFREPKGKHPTFVGCFPFGIRQCPTLPGRHQPSTIGAERLNFCVRYGNRWIPFAITTGMP